MQPDSDPVVRVVEDIVRYLQRHPRAADSAEGIGQWWLPAGSPRVAPYLVEAALERLLALGVVRRELMPDGRTLYRAHDGSATPGPHE